MSPDAVHQKYHDVEEASTAGFVKPGEEEENVDFWYAEDIDAQPGASVKDIVNLLNDSLVVSSATPTYKTESSTGTESRRPSVYDPEDPELKRSGIAFAPAPPGVSMDDHDMFLLHLYDILEVA